MISTLRGHHTNVSTASQNYTDSPTRPRPPTSNRILLRAIASRSQSSSWTKLCLKLVVITRRLLTLPISTLSIETTDYPPKKATCQASPSKRELMDTFQSLLKNNLTRCRVYQIAARPTTPFSEVQAPK